MEQLLPKRKGRFQLWGYTLVFIALIFVTSEMTGTNIGYFFANISQFNIILAEMMHPDWSYWSVVVEPLIETVKMAIVGTTIGAILALPFSLLAARNLVSNRWINGILRFILNIVRTIPDLMLGAIFVAIVGVGPIAGIITLAIFTFGMISKLFYEAIETIDEGPIEAMEAVGANSLQIIHFAVFPQVSSYFLSYFLYAFEINVRASSVLGYIGAGGIGLFLQRSLAQFRYDRTALIIIVIFAVVLVIDTISIKTREALI